MWCGQWESKNCLLWWQLIKNWNKLLTSILSKRNYCLFVQVSFYGPLGTTPKWYWPFVQETRLLVELVIRKKNSGILSTSFSQTRNTLYNDAWREVSIRSNQNHAGRTMMPSGPVVYWKLVQKPTYSLTPAPPNPLFSSRSVVQRTEQICRRPATCPGALGPIWQPWATRLQELLNFHTTYTLTTFKLPELRKPSAHKFG